MKKKKQAPKLYPNDQAILIYLLKRDGKYVWLNEKIFKIDPKTFWRRIKNLEKGGWIEILRTPGMKNKYYLTDKGYRSANWILKRIKWTPQDFDLEKLLADY